jgi:hypothetical protein
MLGDSLSDRGTMANRRLFGFIPMGRVLGLYETSPEGRFTNGFAWTDYLAAMLSNEFLIRDLKSTRDLDSTDIADGLINGDRNIAPLIQQSYTLKKDRVVEFKGKNLVRSYDEGGLTAHDYWGTLSRSMTVFFSRLIVCTLGKMRKKLLADDAAHKFSAQYKLETLVIEWSGANDLILANESPSIAAVNLAVSARVQNIKELIKNGYRHFVLFNLPDIGSTPRFQAKSEADRTNAHHCTETFNLLLSRACQELSDIYPHCSIDIFNVHGHFNQLYEHPEPYFSKDKLKTPYKTSKDFVITPKGTSPAHGYMFWDDVHPTADMHAQLAEFFYAKVNLEYNFTEPMGATLLNGSVLNISEEALLVSFKKKYVEKLSEDRNGFFGNYRRSNMHYQTTTLDQILSHALFEGGHRSLDVIKELQWIDKKNNLNLNIPVLKTALERVHANHKKSKITDPKVTSHLVA